MFIGLGLAAMADLNTTASLDIGRTNIALYGSRYVVTVGGEGHLVALYLSKTDTSVLKFVDELLDFLLGHTEQIVGDDTNSVEEFKICFVHLTSSSKGAIRKAGLIASQAHAFLRPVVVYRHQFCGGQSW